MNNRIMIYTDPLKLVPEGYGLNCAVKNSTNAVRLNIQSGDPRKNGNCCKIGETD